MTMPTIIVTLPPPTPNGGLHVGHMAGPFLAADIFTKALQAVGYSVHVLSYSDTNQSYVRATAERQNCDPQALASGWTQNILETLSAYGCQVDHYFEPNAETNGFVRDTVCDLFNSGILKKRPLPFFYAHERGEFLDEAGVSGLCPRCLDNSKCGICEACGFPTRADTLLAPYSTNAPEEAIELREVEVMSLDLEAWRDEIRTFHSFGEAIRPKYRWLVDDSLAENMPIFPITVPGTWGIAVDHTEFPDQVVNAWCEVAFNFVYGYKRVDSNSVPPTIFNFFGYDNSYFYAILHVALLYAAKLERYLPAATIINEFYNLDNAKFSTSRGHLIWASDLIKDVPPDLVRFYCALTAPGFEQGNFSRLDVDNVLERRLLKPFSRIAKYFAAPVGIDPITNPEFAKIVARAMEARISNSLTQDRFQMRLAAEDAIKGLEAICHCIAQGNISKAGILLILDAWARAIAPIMPDTAANLSASFSLGDVPAELPCAPSRRTETKTLEADHG